MPLVEITVAGRRHAVQCGDGEEERLRHLAAYLDQKTAPIAAANPQHGEAAILLLASLTLADELVDAHEALRRRHADEPAGTDPARNAALAAAVARVAARLEQLAADLEAS